MLYEMFLKSAGVCVGVFVASVVGTGIPGRQDGSIAPAAGSVVLSAAATGLLAVCVMMLLTYPGM